MLLLKMKLPLENLCLVAPFSKCHPTNRQEVCMQNCQYFTSILFQISDYECLSVFMLLIWKQNFKLSGWLRWNYLWKTFDLLPFFQIIILHTETCSMYAKTVFGLMPAEKKKVKQKASTVNKATTMPLCHNHAFVCMRTKR